MNLRASDPIKNHLKNHLRIEIEGLVQGVGFRPFIVKLARKHLQTGWVINTSQGVRIAIEGLRNNQNAFLDDLNTDKPPFSEIMSLTITPKALQGYADFQVRKSITDGIASAFVLPDIATCKDCLLELFDSGSRFYRYPFISCSYCGPRYSIMTEQPYDRIRTSMSGFELCRDCHDDYYSMDNRRFHAQTIACPYCGPSLQMLDEKGVLIAEKQDALNYAIEKIKAGKIIALKSIGGFQLIVDASNQKAVQRLRLRKNRPYKPFALMVRSLSKAHELCFISETEQQTLFSSAAPIVLLKKRNEDSSAITRSAAPDINLLGIMLPYSPLHHLLLSELESPVIATSANRQDEPICIRQEEALERLNGIADYLLTHNRPITRPLDDSIVREINGKMTALRRARGYSSLPFKLNGDMNGLIAAGGQLKSTLALSHQDKVILSQHLGNLESELSERQYVSTFADLKQFYKTKPVSFLYDSHDAYFSSQYVQGLEGRLLPVQHHYAHALSCMAEHQLEPPVLGIIWDGTGLGDDNTLWGGEFLRITPNGFGRFAHFRSFSLPGGVKAIQEPRRAALGLLYEAFGDTISEQCALSFNQQELSMLKTALTKQINCPKTTSAGRLFDAVAAILGLCQFNTYEGEAAIKLENLASAISTEQHYSFTLTGDKPVVIDWQPMLGEILQDAGNHSLTRIAAKFHNTLAEMTTAVAKLAQQEKIVLSGGCFQNAVLVEQVVAKLQAAGFQVFCHEQVPPNDGGLALGQIYAAKYLIQ
ncbi:MAG: carbamoyltransferase HypF [Gammaproteobacteria bacterium]|nr:carbamoyltransferase HypF [Gammaproteobacteria bacterium]